MKRNVILYIATSLDGFIADVNGGIDWIAKNSEMDESDTSYNDFYQSIDTVIMGSTTYNQITTELSPDHYPYSDSKSYVFTSKDREDVENVYFVNADVIETVNRLLKEPGKDIWILGGSSIVTPLVNANLIDVYQIALIPVILARGIPLFNHIDTIVPVKIESVIHNSGMVTYTGRR